MLYEKDLIAKRDEELYQKSSVIKWWQVNYVDNTGSLRQIIEAPEEAEMSELIEEGAIPSGMSDEDAQLANDILARLAAEAAADEAVKQAEIEAALAAAADESNYNATTNSYSGSYGKNHNLDKEAMNQVEDIMDEKNASLEALIAENMK